jgi:hypothetical protein
MLPPVSVPSAAVAIRAATAAALPPLEPPGTPFQVPRVVCDLVGRVLVEDPIANSSILVLPSMTAPSASSLRMAVAV